MSNLKISQLETITNMNEDSYALVVQNGKNYKMSIKEATNSYIDLSNYYTKKETVDTINDTKTELQNSITSNTDLINTTKTELQNSITSNTDLINTTKNELQNSITSNTDLINTTKTELQNSITSNTDLINATKNELQNSITSNNELINTTKTELIGTENTDGTTIWGAKKYAKDLADGLTTRIDSIVSGGVAFKGVVTSMPSNPKNGDLIIIGKEGGITVGSVIYKKDYEYIYSEGAWYELGDSDKNAKAIAAVESKANANAISIQSIDKAYKDADSALDSKINVVSNAAIKSITGGNSTYVTVTASTKDSDGNVTLTVADTIDNTFDTQDSVNSKIDTVKITLIGTSNDAADLDTINGAKAYTDDLVNELSTRVDSIVAGGVAFKGVVTSIPTDPNNGDLVIMSSDYTDGSVTYKKDYEYIYSNGTWYELGDSDKNAKAITAVESKTNNNASAISTLDAAYKAADSDLNSKINAVSNTLIGDNTDGSDVDTIWGAKNYAADLVSALVNSFVAITDEEINGLFTI